MSKNRQLAPLDVMPCSRGNVPLATQHPLRLISSVNCTAYGSQNSCASTQEEPGRPKGRGYYHHQLHCPIPHHHHLSNSSVISEPCCTSDLIKNSQTNSHCRKSTLFPCMAPAQPRVRNACAMHGWTSAKAMTMFSPESRRRNCSDISALLLCATCWTGTSITTNSI